MSLGLRLKSRVVVVICRAALAFSRDKEREEALQALVRNYGLLAGWPRARGRGGRGRPGPGGVG
ncbi:MAG: hypothetical protein ACUVV6_08050 [Thermoplasmatota archaeon]